MLIVEDLFCIEIGANDGNFIDSNDPLLKHLVENKESGGILVEPVPTLFQKLSKVFEERDEIQTLNAVVGNKIDRRPFYFASEKFAMDYPNAPHWKKYQLASFDPSRLLRNVGVTHL